MSKRFGFRRRFLLTTKWGFVALYHELRDALSALSVLGGRIKVI